MDVNILLLSFGLIGTIAFAISGALTAIERDLDILGVIILAVVTACGGGLVRDIMIGDVIQMFSDPIYPLIALITGIVVILVMSFLTSGIINNRIYKIFFNIIDSIGLGAFIITGATVAISVGQCEDMFPIVFYSVLTAVGGGMLRDICVGKIPVIFRKHFYATAAIIGALIYYLMLRFNAPTIASVCTTTIAVVLLRYLAFHFEWSLPKVRSRA